MLNPITVAETAIVRSAPAVGAIAARNPLAAAILVVGVGGLAAWKYGELAYSSFKRSPSLGDMVRAAKRGVHNLTAEVAEKTAPTEDEDVATTATARPPLQEVRTAAIRVKQQKKTHNPRANGAAAPAAKAA